MSFLLDFTKQANEDIDFYKKSGNTVILKKLNTLFLELIENPFIGTGKPEMLKYELTGLWSRRINQEHRLVYQVIDDVVIILSVKGHY